MPLTDDRLVDRWEVLQLSAMGSPAEVVIGDGPNGLVTWAVSELGRLERCWSRFDPESALARLNASSGRAVEVDPLLGFALRRALALGTATDGLFDPTVHDALVSAGYDRTFEQVAPSCDEPFAGPHPVHGPAGIEVAPDGGWVCLPPGVHVDLGGLGKGLAADLMAEGLVERGAGAACVSLGGDIRVAGVPPHPEGWSIPVEDPFRAPDLLGTALLRPPGAVVTSTRLVRRWWRAGVELHHLIDPRAGRPARSGLAAVVVEASEAWWAEGLAKAALVAGPERGRALLERHGLAGWLVTDEGTSLRVGLGEELS